MGGEQESDINMPRSKDEIDLIIAGSGLLAGFWDKFCNEVREQGGIADDLHRLERREGLPLIKAMAGGMWTCAAAAAAAATGTRAIGSSQSAIRHLDTCDTGHFLFPLSLVLLPLEVYLGREFLFESHEGA